MKDEAEIEAGLRARRTEERIRAVKQAAGLASSPGRQRLLLGALSDVSPYVAALAAEALGEDVDDRTAGAMVERFEVLSADGPRLDPGCQIRANLAFSLGRLEYRPAASALRVGIRTVQIEAVGGVPFDTASHLRANCALGLAALRDPDCVRDISLLLFDRSGYAVRGMGDDPALKMEPRKAAARALALTGSLQARLPLTLCLVYPENELPEVLQECMTALVDLEDPRAVEVLTPYLRRADQPLAAYAALMIARTRAPEAAALIAETVRHLSGDPMRAALLALTTLRTDAADALLRDLAESERAETRIAAAELLPDDAESQMILERLAARDPAPKVRLAAQAALDARP
jgi:HEAT repeat protein